MAEGYVVIHDVIMDTLVFASVPGYIYNASLVVCNDKVCARATVNLAELVKRVYEKWPEQVTGLSLNVDFQHLETVLRAAAEALRSRANILEESWREEREALLEAVEHIDAALSIVSRFAGEEDA